MFNDIPEPPPVQVPAAKRSTLTDPTFQIVAMTAFPVLTLIFASSAIRSSTPIATLAVIAVALLQLISIQLAWLSLVYFSSRRAD